MDTLFRLVSLHQHHHHPQATSPDQQHHHQSPYSSSRSTSRSTTSTGSRSSPPSHHTHNHHYYSHSHSHYNSSNSSGSYYYYDPAVGSGSAGGGGGYCYDHHQPAPYQEECGNDHGFYMDEDFSSSSSSRHFHQSSSSSRAPPAPATQPPPSSPAPTPTQPPSTSSAGGHAGGLFEAADFSFPHVDIDLDFSSPVSSSAGAAGGTAASSSGGGGAGRWAAQLLLECARAVAAHDSQRVQQLMWMLNELASPYGDVDQKLASYFLQGLFARLTTSGPRTLRTLAAASDRNTSFESTRRTALKFQELSPWTSFGHVAANGAILETFLEAAASAAAASSSSSQPPRLQILDLSNTFCTQWPTLLEALATRSSDDTPHLSITTVVPTAAPSAAAQCVMREIAQRLEKFARLMGVPFSFRTVHHVGDLADLDLDGLDLREGGATTALAINCVNALRGVAPGGARRRDAFLASLRRLEPRVVTVVEEDADLVASESDASSEEANTEAAFMKVFTEGLRFFSAYMDSLEDSFPKTSNERLALERAAGRAIVDLVSCPASESAERRETGASWARRMRSAGFSPLAFSDDVADDMRSLLRRYREGWSLREPGTDDDAAAAGVFLAWKEQPVVWTSAWRP
ncbi:Protein SHORT-ROOT 2 [Dichanthelium oligosanthes]|uniref:Protein SHORT-ROOT 2 n=1 Tax=Dichanthelium oligosanthes TaxID=888268 RepID=A0A1E5WBK0_9POAL|nr:Protein SHORT-ROOT 2 [Dichanthelium oligosanthes]